MILSKLRRCHREKNDFQAFDNTEFQKMENHCSFIRKREILRTRTRNRI